MKASRIPQSKALLIAGGLLTLGILFGLLCCFGSPGQVATMLTMCAVGMAVTADQLVTKAAFGRRSLPMEESTTIYGGTYVFENAAGYADDDTASGVNNFAGIAVQKYDNSSGADGALSCEVYTEGEFLLTGSGFAQTSVGKNVYATDNYTLTLNAAGGVLVGRITKYVSATSVWVAIDAARTQGPLSDVGTLAAAGSAQGDAAAIVNRVTHVSAADGTKGVILPAAFAGAGEYRIYNLHATNGLKIYPASGDDINDGTGDAAVTIEGKTVAVFTALDAATWAATYTVNS